MQMWFDVARVEKAKTHNGGFIVAYAMNPPFSFEEGMEVHFVPPVLDAPRAANVASVSPVDERRACVYFGSSCESQDFECLVGCHCLVDASLVDEQRQRDVEEHYIGYQVIDVTTGRTATVIDYLARPAQDLLSLSVDQAGADDSASNSQEVLVPFVDDFLVDVDRQGRLLKLRLPRGILDL